MYAVSMGVPALRLADGIEFGGLTWLQSYVFGFGFVVDLFDPPKTTGQWFRIDERLPFACLLGMVANTLLILGWIYFYLARYRRRQPWAARWLAWGSFGFMIASVVPIALMGDLGALYPGFGLWTASALLLALGATGSNGKPASSSTAG
ncbi:MAG: hypothetical protein L0228_07270 [Planctomycetes bacterium]|nr:hypothetical protein [Planctomycetota bacterium]